MNYLSINHTIKCEWKAKFVETKESVREKKGNGSEENPKSKRVSGEISRCARETCVIERMCI